MAQSPGGPYPAAGATGRRPPAPPLQPRLVRFGVAIDRDPPAPWQRRALANLAASDAAEVAVVLHLPGDAHGADRPRRPPGGRRAGCRPRSSPASSERWATAHRPRAGCCPAARRRGVAGRRPGAGRAPRRGARPDQRWRTGARCRPGPRGLMALPLRPAWRLRWCCRGRAGRRLRRRRLSPGTTRSRWRSCEMTAIRCGSGPLAWRLTSCGRAPRPRPSRSRRGRPGAPRRWPAGEGAAGPFGATPADVR